MAFNAKTASIIGGAAFGAYASDITDDPLSGIISTGIGATMGGFMKVPSFSVKEMSKVSIGPSLDMSLISGAEAPSAFSSNELKTNLIDLLDRDQKYIDNLQKKLSNKVAKYDENRSKIIQKRERALESLEKSKSHLNNRIQRSLNWLDERVNNSAISYDNKIKYLEERMKEATSAFENSRESMFSREVKRGADKNYGRVPYYINDPEFSDLLDKWVVSQPDDHRKAYQKAGKQSATNKIESNPAYYEHLAARRRHGKLSRSETTMINARKQFSDFRLSLDGEGRAVFDKNEQINKRISITDKATGEFVTSLDVTNREDADLIRYYKRVNNLANSNYSTKSDSKMMTNFHQLANRLGMPVDDIKEYSFNTYYQVGEDWISKSEFTSYRAGVADSYNRAKWLRDKITSDMPGALVYEKNRIHENITKGFTRYHAVTDFIADPTSGLNLNKLDSKELEIIKNSDALREILVDRIGGYSSLSADDYKSQINELQTNREQYLNSIRESLKGSYEKHLISNLHLGYQRGELEQKINDTITEYSEKLENLSNEKNTTLSELSQKINNSNYNNMVNYLNTTGVKINSVDDLKKYIGSLNNSDILNKLNQISKGTLVDLRKVKGLQVEESTNMIKVGPNQVDELAAHFEQVLGHSPELAREKAEMFASRANGNIFLKDGTISFTDDVTGKSATIPLTSYSKGSRFHYAGNGNYQTVSQFNPYGNFLNSTKKANIDGTLREVVAKDLLVGQDPEMMLKYLPKDSPISSILPNIRSLFHYNSSESGSSVVSLGSDFDPTKTQAFVNSQGVVNLGYTLNTNEYGEIDPTRPFKKLNIMSNNGQISERDKMFNEMVSQLGLESAHLSDGLSLNSLTEIQTKGFDSIAMLGPNERNETGVGNRGYELLQRNSQTQALADLYGEERFNRQFSSSQALTKLDVVDSALFNEISSKLYGNDKVLADGAGFFKLGTQDLTVKDKAILKIPLAEAGIHNEQLLAAIQSGDISKYLAENNIVIGNETLASLKDRNISLNKMYTSGTIVGGYLTENDLRLEVDAIFDPNEEANSKLFSAGTKSLNTGINVSSFENMTGLGKLINAGILRKEGNNILIGDRVLDLTNKDDLAYLNSQMNSNKLVGVQMISDASETGMKKIMQALSDSGDKPHVLKGDKVFDALVSSKGQQIAALTALTFGEHKAAVDLMATLGIAFKTKTNTVFDKAIEAARQSGGILDINSQMYKDIISSGFVNTKGPLSITDLNRAKKESNKQFTSIFDKQAFLSSKDKLGHLTRAADLLERLEIVSDLKSGRAFAIGSFNKGMSIVGAGNSARMSWNAIANLKASGMTDEQFELFGKRNFGLMYEVRSTINERSISNASVNNAIRGMEARFASIINSNSDPEKRLELFEKFFGKNSAISNNPYLTYNLTDPSSEIKSINFSRLSTTRSGFYEKDDGVALLKDLDKKKVDLMFADVAYRDANTKESKESAKLRLDRAVKEYISYTNKMYSGDNNLAKEALALESSHSDIMQVKGIGGEAEKYSDKAYAEKRHVWFISEEEAQHKLNQISRELVYKEDTGFAGLKRAGYLGDDGKWIPLASILTREPAQGPMSSDLVEWVVDKDLKGKGNAYVSNNLQYYAKGMFGDMDQDTVQTLLGDFKTSNQFEELNSQRSKVRSSFQEMVPLLDAIKLKGKSAEKMKSLADFDSEEQYAEYRFGAAKKGRARKTLSAPATGLAVAYSKAMELELGSVNGNEDRLLKGRMLSHQLVENLIKSAHMDTEDFIQAKIQPVEELTNARKNYIGKGKTHITAGEYEAVLREHLPKFLNIDKLNKTSVEGIKGRSIMEDIIKSELNQSVKVGNNPMNPMDLAEHRNKTTFSQTLADVFEASGVESDIGSFKDTMRTSSGRVASGMTDIVKDVIKNNKGVLMGGFAAMAGVAILGRESPSFSDSRENVRQHSSKMLRAPGSYDESSVNNTPMGMSTNTIKSNYITPKSFGSKNLQVKGDFIEQGISEYNEFTSLLEPDNIQDQIHNMTNAAFGDGIRSARLQTN